MTEKHLKKNFCKDYTSYKDIIFINNEKVFGEKNQSKKEKISKNKQKVNTVQLIKKAFDLQAQGRKLEAAKYYEYLIKQGIKDYRIFSNFGIFLNEIGKHKESESKLKKAISLNLCFKIFESNSVSEKIFLSR